MDKAPGKKRLLWVLAGVAGSLLCAATALGFAGRVWWVFDLSAHFRVQYFFALTVLLILLLLGSKYRLAAVCGLCVALNLGCILPYYLSGRAGADTGASVLRVLSFNVHCANRNFASVTRYLLESDADILLVLEVDEGWVEALKEIEAAYPYHKFEPCRDNFGLAIYSKLPALSCEAVYLGQAQLPSLVGEFEAAGKRVTLLGTHLYPPTSAAEAHLRDEQVAAIAAYIAAVPGPKILMGDLNMSPWSHAFAKLLRSAGLVDSSRGSGVQPTWPVRAAWLRIPIDFCLVSTGIRVKSHRVGPDLGSDHFPVVVDFTALE